MEVLKMSVKNLLKQGGRMLAILLLVGLMPQAVHAVALQGTNINCLGDLGDGDTIYNQDGKTPLPVGSVLQIIDSVNNASEDPKSDGTPSDPAETVLATIAVGEGTDTAGTFYKYFAGDAHNEKNYLYIRAWNANSINTATHYGDSELKLIDHGENFPSPINWAVAAFSTNIPKGGQPPQNDPTISSVAPNAAYVGQTIVISGTNFGSSGTVTVGGKTANPTAWSASSITLAVPSGATTGNAVVTVGGKTANSPVTIKAGGAVIDDVEGGSVGTWAQGLADSGYYAFGAGVTPDKDNIVANGPQAEALMHGAKGMKIKYSYLSDWGGGWGAKLANTMDLSSFDKINFYIKWDGSNNDLKLTLKDSAGHVYGMKVSNAVLKALGGYSQVSVDKSVFTEDIDDPSRTQGAIDWTKVNSYNIAYITQGTTSNYQYIDSITAGTVDLGGGTQPPPPTGEVVITKITPPAGPAGTNMTITGVGFGDAQGQSSVVFENSNTKVSYVVSVNAWGNTSIEAIVPSLAPAGNYTLKVVKLAIAAGTIRALESNPSNYQVTAGMSASGIATVYPNPFNPLATQLSASGTKVSETIIAYNTGGAQNIGIYIYDTTGQLVYHGKAASSQTAWNGRDSQGKLVGDGLYLLRVVNEDGKGLISKGKILVIKK